VEAAPDPGDDATRYDAEPVPEERRRRSVWSWLLPLLLALAVLGGLVWFLLARDADPVGRAPSPTGTVSTSAVPVSPSPAPQVSAPAADTVEVLAARYEGRPVDDVVQELSDLGFAVEREGRASDEDPDTVVGLDPVGQVQRGSTITVHYSTGPDTVDLPTGMVGQPAQPLIDRIRLLGVNITLYEEPTDEAAPDTVLRTKPLGGSTVRPGDTIEMWVAVAPRTGSPEPAATPTATSAPPGTGQEG
jgi:hypothetical protein